MKVIDIKDPGKRAKRARIEMEKVGTDIGGVTFFKRSTGKVRSMAYRIGVKNPSFAKTPNGKGDKTGKGTHARKKRDADNLLMTVFDVNAVTHGRTVKTKRRYIVGRGAWKSIPLDTVIKVNSNGNKVLFKKYC